MASPQPRSRPPRNDDGLTLIEMVVAIGVLMVVLMSSLAVFITVQKAQQTAEGTDRAIQLANSRIERLRQLDWKNVGFYQNTYDTERVKAPTTGDYPYTRRITETGDGATSTIILGPTDPITGTTATDYANKIKPYELTTADEARNRFHVYTTITWGRDSTLGLPSTSATTPTGQYSFKRVRVTVIWQSNGNGAMHKIVNETSFAPPGYQEAPPGVVVQDQ